jgi:hypothetical protein
MKCQIPLLWRSPHCRHRNLVRPNQEYVRPNRGLRGRLFLANSPPHRIEAPRSATPGRFGMLVLQRLEDDFQSQLHVEGLARPNARCAVVIADRIRRYAQPARGQAHTITLERGERV